MGKVARLLGQRIVGVVVGAALAAAIAAAGGTLFGILWGILFGLFYGLLWQSPATALGLPLLCGAYFGAGGAFAGLLIGGFGRMIGGAPAADLPPSPKDLAESSAAAAGKGPPALRPGPHTANSPGPVSCVG
jgi:hypothetical protein